MILTDFAILPEMRKVFPVPPRYKARSHQDEDSPVTVIAAPLGQRSAQIEVEADVDLGVTSRLLDLLVVHGRFPQRMNLARDGATMMVTLSLPEGTSPEARLLAKMRAIPGVRRADELTPAP